MKFFYLVYLPLVSVQCSLRSKRQWTSSDYQYFQQWVDYVNKAYRTNYNYNYVHDYTRDPTMHRTIQAHNAPAGWSADSSCIPSCNYGSYYGYAHLPVYYDTRSYGVYSKARYGQNQNVYAPYSRNGYVTQYGYAVQPSNSVPSDGYVTPSTLTTQSYRTGYNGYKNSGANFGQPPVVIKTQLYGANEKYAGMPDSNSHPLPNTKSSFTVLATTSSVLSPASASTTTPTSTLLPTLGQSTIQSTEKSAVDENPTMSPEEDKTISANATATITELKTDGVHAESFLPEVSSEPTPTTSDGNSTTSSTTSTTTTTLITALTQETASSSSTAVTGSITVMGTVTTETLPEGSGDADIALWTEEFADVGLRAPPLPIDVAEKIGLSVDRQTS